jgi:hypothetical protein
MLVKGFGFRDTVRGVVAAAFCMLRASGGGGGPSSSSFSTAKSTHTFSHLFIRAVFNSQSRSSGLAGIALHTDTHITAKQSQPSTI